MLYGKTNLLFCVILLRMKRMTISRKQKLAAGIAFASLLAAALAGWGIHHGHTTKPASILTSPPILAVQPITVKPSGPQPDDVDVVDVPQDVLPPVAVQVPDARPKIAVLIDDMGVNRRNSDSMADLPAALSLSFLPYADNLQAQVDAAREKGHEIWLHLPMQPLGTADPGPNALMDDMSPETLLGTLETNLDSFTGYVGVNNHMGSRLTSDEAAMAVIMPALETRHILFLDSLTTAKSVARQFALDNGIPFHARDVFIDHEETAEAAHGALEHLEALARKRGSAIAIGHPKVETIAALAQWIPTLEEKGFVLVPLSRLYSSPESSSEDTGGKTRSTVR